MVKKIETPEHPKAPSSQGGELLEGRYRLVRWIASGGMGSVWLARDTVLGRRVAIKILSDSMASNGLASERFRREAKAAAALTHPNVARVYDFHDRTGIAGYPGRTWRGPFIVMEFVEGEALTEILARRGRLPVAEAVSIATQAAAALEAAHRAGIVHRDVKPGNIMLTHEGVVKVMDFGIAVVAHDPKLTATGAGPMGTANYLAPERAAGAPGTPASDVYSLGVVLYEMLTGFPPFAAETPAAVALSHIQDDPRPLGDVVPDLPDHVSAVCQQALAKDPADRPPSARAFATSLRGQATTIPMEPVPPPLAWNGAVRTEPIEPLTRTEPLHRPPPPASASPTKPLEREPSPRTFGPAKGVEARPPVRSWTRRRWGLGLAALGFLVLLLLGLSSVWDRGGAGNVRMPNLVGMTVDQAEASVADNGLGLGRVISVPGQPGIVVSTSPAPGVGIPPASVVDLYVGSTPAPASPPDNGHGHKGHKGSGNGDGNGGGD